MNQYSFFSCSDYRECLELERESLKEHFPDQYSIQEMATYCQIHRSYLSKVIHKKAHLSEDQLFLAKKYLNLDEAKDDFIELLYKYQRTELPERKKVLEKQIKKINDKDLHVKKSQREKIRKSLTPKQKERYFLDPYAQIFHMLITIREYQENPKKILESLQITQNVYVKTINFLEELGVIEFKNKKIVLHIPEVTLSFSSPVTEAYHSLARDRGHSRMLGVSKEERNIYTLLFTTDQSTHQVIRKRYIKFLEEVVDLVGKSDKVDTLYEMHFDLFPWNSK